MVSVCGRGHGQGEQQQAVAYTLWYAGRVKAYPAKSLCGISAEDAELAQADARAPKR